MTDIITFLNTVYFDQEVWIWGLFLTFIAGLLYFDLGYLHKKSHTMTFRQSAGLTAFYISIAFLFGLWIAFEYGSQRAMTFYTAYLVEESLSLDNIFVMSVILAFYKIPLKYQHRVLFWGIIGVIVLRGIVIVLGTALVAKFSWVLLIFGALLIFTGLKIMFSKHDDDGPDLEHSKIRQFMIKHFRVTNELHGNHFFVKQTDEKGVMRTWITPLFMALITIEVADLVFAMDSIPAVLAITDDTFIVFTSNIFAIMGLRAMYFLLAVLLDRFAYLRYALSLVLIMIGGKVFYTHIAGEHVDEWISLSLTVGILALGMVISIFKTRKTH